MFCGGIGLVFVEVGVGVKGGGAEVGRTELEFVGTPTQ
jgi:hypothetical protein